MLKPSIYLSIYRRDRHKVRYRASSTPSLHNCTSSVMRLLLLSPRALVGPSELEHRQRHLPPSYLGPGRASRGPPRGDEAGDGLVRLSAAGHLAEAAAGGHGDGRAEARGRRAQRQRQPAWRGLLCRALAVARGTCLPTFVPTYSLGCVPARAAARGEVELDGAGARRDGGRNRVEVGRAEVPRQGRGESAQPEDPLFRMNG
eukprot:scaffold31785_cov72-Phaeocystis_antarctica.AAC.12